MARGGEKATPTAAERSQQPSLLPDLAEGSPITSSVGSLPSPAGPRHRRSWAAHCCRSWGPYRCPLAPDTTARGSSRPPLPLDQAEESSTPPPPLP
uniref:Uncharacterized protein n=1 Tax=Oryza punctata TaxID=4537 RepID=A0A0E0KMV7_ORYPU